MARRWTQGVTGGLAAAGLLFACALPSQAQETGGGNFAELRFSPRLTWEDGDLRTAIGTGLSLTSETRRSSIGLFLDGGLEQSSEDGSGLTVTDPQLRLTFGHESRSSTLEASLRYRESDVDTLFEDEALGPGIVVFDDGTRKDLSANLGLEVGRDAPFGGSLDLGYSALTYSGTTDPSLLDEETLSTGLSLRFTIDPRIQARFSASVIETERDSPGLDVRTETVGLGLNLEVTKRRAASLYLGQTRIVQSGAGPRSIEQGLAYALSVTEARPNGEITGSLESDIDEAGRRTTARIVRSLELPTGRLRAGLGLSEGSDNDLRPLLSLAWGRDLPRGTLGLTFDQSFSTNSEGAEALNSRLRLFYRQELTPFSGFETAIRLGDTDFLGSVSDNTRQIELDLVYRHDLVQDWDFVGGYTHTISREAGARRSHSDEVFISLEKRIQWRF